MKCTPRQPVIRHPVSSRSQGRGRGRRGHHMDSRRAGAPTASPFAEAGPPHDAFATQQNLEEAETPVGRSTSPARWTSHGAGSDRFALRPRSRREGRALAAPFRRHARGPPRGPDMNPPSRVWVRTVRPSARPVRVSPRCSVLALALTHSGSRTWSSTCWWRDLRRTSDLPHVSAMIFEPESEPPWSTVCRTPCRARWRACAGGQLNVRPISPRGQARFPPLPALFIVLTSSMEMLLEAKPEFGEVFTMIGRLGPVGAPVAGFTEDGPG